MVAIAPGFTAGRGLEHQANRNVIVGQALLPALRLGEDWNTFALEGGREGLLLPALRLGEDWNYKEFVYYLVQPLIAPGFTAGRGLEPCLLHERRHSTGLLPALRLGEDWN
jgi:hypothetical protein